MKSSKKVSSKSNGEAMSKNRYRFRIGTRLGHINTATNEVNGDMESHRLIRICDIVGTGGILPISKSNFLANVRLGIYPQPIKISPRCTAWREVDILKIAKYGVQ